MPENLSTEEPFTSAAASQEGRAESDERPRFRVIPLDCEITSYAPDGDGPLS